jgi:fucose permease
MPIPVLLGISLFVIGIGLGAFELGPNSLIVTLHRERKGLYLNLMAVLHGLGSLIAPLFAGWLFSLDFTWRVVYRWDLAMIVFFMLFTTMLPFPKTDESSQLDFRQIPSVAFKGKLPWFYLAIMFYVAAEIGIGSWLVTFLQDARGVSVILSNQALSLFFGTVMVGRLLGGLFVQRIGYVRSILFAAIGAFVCVGIGLFAPSQFSFVLSLTGLFFSFVFPTLTAAASDTHTENLNTVLGVLFTFAGIGGLLGPWLLGWSSDAFGLEKGFAFNLVFISGLILSTFVLRIGGMDGKTA